MQKQIALTLKAVLIRKIPKHLLYSKNLWIEISDSENNIFLKVSKKLDENLNNKKNHLEVNFNYPGNMYLYAFYVYYMYMHVHHILLTHNTHT